MISASHVCLCSDATRAVTIDKLTAPVGQGPRGDAQPLLELVQHDERIVVCLHHVVWPRSRVVHDGVIGSPSKEVVCLALIRVLLDWEEYNVAVYCLFSRVTCYIAPTL